MGKLGKQRKKLRLQKEANAAIITANKHAAPSSSSLSSSSSSKRPRNDNNNYNNDVISNNNINIDNEDDDDDLVGGAIRASDLSVTISVLTALEDSPDLMRGKAFKGLRVALHRLNQAMTKEGVSSGNSLTGRISDALADSRWNDALVALAEMRERKQTPKLGALQRWVRDCDAVQGGSTSAPASLDGDPQVLRVLDAILRTADPSMVPLPADGADSLVQVVHRQPPWAVRPLQFTHHGDGDGDGGDGGDDVISTTTTTATLTTTTANVDYRTKFRVVAHEKGAQRRTPNLHDFILYTSEPGTIPRAPAHFPSVVRHGVPNVPGAFIMTDVLSRTQCKQILAAAEQVGFTPDAPVAGAAGEQTSILAHNLFWLADHDILTNIMERCSPHLPLEVNGGALAGLNARWRVYRYVPGAVYRPHIDGAWPGSGLHAETGAYEYDLYKDRRSKLTFLIYLNEEFEGGATTFFTPAAAEGKMNSWPVRPRTGCVVCFPHGEAKGALLHEGSAIMPSTTTGSTKYIIRTDVLYMTHNQDGTVIMSNE
eukprot:TRINITY_DN4139_c0_g1_i2.p1 TRINITY_DN4139_c0_g1~~TRINITY_DN4139_c0_g1_i2.p1  ORF type:complete len:540 (+),score=116.92 TRINITY_DN4139_c0_g1_i2:92-1711(+)